MCSFSDQVKVLGIDLIAEQFTVGFTSHLLRMTKLQVFMMRFQPASISLDMDAVAGPGWPYGGLPTMFPCDSIAC